MKRLGVFMFAVAITLVGLGAQTTAQAVPARLTVGGDWQQFYWSDVPGPTFEAEELSADGYILTATEQVYLNITDAFFAGDSFNVLINGALALSTPSVASNSSVAPLSTPILAFGNSNFSWGQIALNPGTYNILVSVREGASSGGGFIQATPVPEPATMLLFGAGLAGIAASARKRRSAVHREEESAM